MDWPFDYHDSGALRTGLGVVACPSHNTVTTTMSSICIFNQKYLMPPWFFLFLGI